jgi:signal peptidase I
MTETQDTAAASLFATMWLSPRATIERIVASRPTYLVLPLAMLGTIATSYVELVASGLGGQLSDWRLWLAIVTGSAIFGVVWLYLSGLLLKWIGNMLGGDATALQLRAVVAWSMVPSIAGGVIAAIAVLIAKAAGGSEAVIHIGIPWLSFVVSLWAIIVFMLMLARGERFGFWRTIFAFVLNLVVSALLVVVSARTLLYQPFNIPAGSMVPTLLVGDYVFAAKFPYGYSRFSLPFSPPLFSGRIMSAEPARGDVVIFRLPKDGRTDYVKRLVGLPGDHIQMKQGELFINGVAVKREPVAEFTGDACGAGGAYAKVKRWRETLPNGVSYETLDCVDNGFYDNTVEYVVPPGYYFMLGTTATIRRIAAYCRRSAMSRSKT